MDSIQLEKAWVVGVVPAIVDATIVVNHVMHNTKWVPGMYGDEWSIKDIKRLELMDEMPEVLARTNGVGLPTLSKGHFKVKDYGKSLLFIQKGSSPYIYIELEKRRIFINDNDSEQTIKWFKELQEEVGNNK